MQSVAGYPTNTEVLEPTALVIVDGLPVKVSSLSVSRELSATVPTQVQAGTGLTAATGSVTWAVGDDVQKRSAHPWDGSSFPPKPADEAVVFAGYGSALARQLTGSIDESQGSIASGDVSSALVDPIDKLNRDVSFPALLSTMPTVTEGGEHVRVGLQPTYYTDRILRECGFYATPPKAIGCVFSAPNMGSAWPEVGTAIASSREDIVGTPIYTDTPWGWGLASGDSTYIPDFSGAGNNGRLSRTMQITVKARPRVGTGGASYVRAIWGTTYIALLITSGRTIWGNITHNGSTTTVCALSSTSVADADTFTLRVTPDGTFTLFSNNGQSSSGTYALPSVVTDTDMTRTRVAVSHLVGVVIGGAQVNFGHANVFNAQRTATLTPGASTQTIFAFPRIEPTNALDLLKEQAEAECAAMWIDEHGHFRWVNRNVLTSAAPVSTLTALNDVLDIGWESSASGVRSRVIVTSREASITRSPFSNQIAWQGKGASLEAGEELEEIATPPADTDWLGVDENLRVLPPGGTAGLHDFNRSRGTWAGGIATNDAGTQWATISNPSFSVELEKLEDSVYKFTTNAGSPPGGRTIELRTPGEESSTAIWRSRRNMDLPVLRAKAVVEWIDRETIGLHIGPENAATLEHNVGAWVQDPAALQSLADWLSVQVFEPKPVLRDLSVIPDFRRQLSDVVWVEDKDNMRIRLKVLITKITTSVSAGAAEQTIGGRILEVQRYGATNAQLDAHAASRTNASFDTLWADATNAQLDNDPLGRG